MVLGTAGYMSPEQVRGEAARCAVRHLQPGSGALRDAHAAARHSPAATPADTMAAILKDDPPDSRPPMSAGARAHRLAVPGEVARGAVSVGARSGVRLGVSAGTATGRDGPRRRRLGRDASAAPIAVWPSAASSGALALALCSHAWAPWRRRAAATRSFASARPRRRRPAGRSISTVRRATTHLAQGDRSRFRRRRSRREPAALRAAARRTAATPLPAPTSAIAPFFSPDGRWIGFFAEGQLKKIAVTGGAADNAGRRARPARRRVERGRHDRVLARSDCRARGCCGCRRPAGHAEPLDALADGEVIQVWPQVLPGGKGVLYTGSRVPGVLQRRQSHGAAADGRTRRSSIAAAITAGTVRAGISSTSTTERFSRSPFDLDRLEVTGEPVRARDAVMSNAVTGARSSPSPASGTLVYGRGKPPAAHPLAVDRPRRNDNAAANHAGELAQSRVLARWGRLAMEIRDGPPDIWVHDWRRQQAPRLTSDPFVPSSRRGPPTARESRSPRHAPTSRRSNLWWQRADGTADAQRLTESSDSQMPGSWHPSGKFLGLRAAGPQTDSDLMILPIDGAEASGWKPGTPTVVPEQPARRRDPMFSPDGRWLAYVSDGPDVAKYSCGRSPELARGSRFRPAGAARRPGRARATRSSTAPTADHGRVIRG